MAWPGDRVITTLVATRHGELDAAGFRFPLLGRLPYKGFFDRELAAREARRLRAEGLDVCEVPVRAYSTLGWFDDPVTTPMLDGSALDFADTLLHEFVHATVYVPGDADLNESAATFVGREASVAFAAREPLGASTAAAARAHARARVHDLEAIDAALLRFRDRVAQVNAAGGDADERARVEATTREALARLPLRTRDPAAFAEQVRLNDACLALRGTYAADLPGHAAVFEARDGHLEAFVERLRAAAQAPDPRAAFFSLAAPGEAPGP